MQQRWQLMGEKNKRLKKCPLNTADKNEKENEEKEIDQIKEKAREYAKETKVSVVN